MKNENQVNKLIDDLKAIFSDRIVSVILFGSCTAEQCDAKISDINTIVIIDKLCASDLKNSLKPIKEWTKSKNPLPIFMDKEEWYNSTDIYPIEYSDIKDRFKILYGTDVVSGLEISTSNLRLQCEYEVKNILIRLRQAYLLHSNNHKIIEELLKTSSKSYTAIFRAILRLTETDINFDKNATIDQLSKKVDIDITTFKRLLLFRTDTKVINQNEINDIIQKLIDSTNNILKYVDKL